MNALVKTTKVIDKIVKVIGTCAAYLSIVMMLLMLFEVFSRRIFHSPTIWSYETVTFLFGAMVMLILPYGLQLGVNVRVDVVYNKFSDRVRNILDIVLFAVFFGIFMFVFTRAAIPYFSKSLSSLERSWSSWSPILWPVKSTIPVCGVLMLLQGISELIKMFFVAFGKGDLVDLQKSGEDSTVEEALERVEEIGEVEEAAVIRKAEEYRCPYCNKKIKPTLSFCPKCGEYLLQIPVENEKEGGTDK